MTDKTRASEQAARVERIAREAEALLGMAGQFDLKYIFDPGHDGDSTYDPEHRIFGTTAITSAKWQYRGAKIRWFLPVCTLQSDDELLFTAIHELVHVLMAPIAEHLPNGKDHVNKAEEFATESITRAIWAALGRPFPS